jgi:hypothetical protein
MPETLLNLHHRASTTEHVKTSIPDRSLTGFAYFYCSFDTLASQQSVNILASILVQLCFAVPALYDDLLDRYSALAEKQTPQAFDFKEFEAILASHYQPIPPIPLSRRRQRKFRELRS